MRSLVERTAAYWLEKAEAARARADEMHEPSSRQTLLEISVKYDQMAQRAEGREARARAAPDKRRF